MTRTLDQFRFEHSSDMTALAGTWRVLEKASPPAPFQSYRWVENWWRHVAEPNGFKLHVVVVRDQVSEPVVLFPFVVIPHFGARVLEWAGDSHSAWRGPLVQEAMLDEDKELCQALLKKALSLVSKSYDLASLREMPAQLHGRDNPFLLGKPFFSGNKRLHGAIGARRDAVSLPFAADGMPTGLKKKLRWSFRKLEEHGPVRFVVAETDDERLAMLDALIAQKSPWFVERGIEDFFADSHICSFLKGVALMKPAAHQPHTSLAALYVGDEPVGMAMNFVQGSFAEVMLLSRSLNPELERYSPGQLFLTRLADWMAVNGIAELDLGVGDGLHKDRFASEVSLHMDGFAARTVPGYMLLGIYLGRQKLKALIKGNGWLFDAYKRARAVLANAGLRSQEAQAGLAKADADQDPEPGEPVSCSTPKKLAPTNQS